MSQPPEDPFYPAPMNNNNYPSWQQTPQIPGNARPTTRPNYPPQPNATPNQNPMNQPSFAPQGYSQRPALTYAGQQPQPQPEIGSSPFPQPGSLPKNYNFPASSAGNTNPSAQGQAVYDQPTSKLSVPPTPPKKSRKGRAIASVLVLLLLITGGVGTFFTLHQSHTNASKATTHVTATTTQTSTNTAGTLGQPLQAGPNWLMTITRVHSNTASDYPPKAGYTYMEISITLKNVSPNTQFISSMIEFTLTDNNGGHYIESVNDTYTRQAVDGHLSMNQTLTGQVAYEVPQTQHQFVLMFHYGLPDGSSEAVSWNIAI